LPPALGERVYGLLPLLEQRSEDRLLLSIGQRLALVDLFRLQRRLHHAQRGQLVGLARLHRGDDVRAQLVSDCRHLFHLSVSPFSLPMAAGRRQ